MWQIDRWIASEILIYHPSVAAIETAINVVKLEDKSKVLTIAQSEQLTDKIGGQLQVEGK